MSFLTLDPLDVLGLSYPPEQLLGIPVALVAAILLSVGAQLQHHAVGKVDDAPADISHASAGLNFKQLGELIKRPSWVIGAFFLGLAIVFQLVSLTLSPLTLVQPLGVAGLVFTSLLNSRVNKFRLNQRSIRAIAMCVTGVALFVIVAAIYTRARPVSTEALITILIILGVILTSFWVGVILFRHKFNSLVYMVGAGVLFGFVAILAKVTIERILNQEWDVLLLVCILSLILAAVLGSYFVQNAYLSGPPDLVIAGLTVIDPLVAVTIGLVILNEAALAPPWVFGAFAVFGLIAIYGVFELSKHHPQTD